MFLLFFFPGTCSQNRLVEQLADTMQFEWVQDSRLDFLPATAVNEIIQDLSGRADRVTADDNCESSAEAAYQLAIVHFEGNCVAKDYSKALKWLETAAVGGCNKAISACPNVFDSCKEEMPDTLIKLVNSKMADAAKSELAMSLLATTTNTIAIEECFMALHQWAKNDEAAYLRYLTSAEYGSLTLFCVEHFHGTRTSNPLEEGGSFDFDQLEGYGPHGRGRLRPSDKAQFIRAVRKHRCVEKTCLSGLTLLQSAAARGDLSLAEVMVEDLGAKVDGVGATPDFTPLWISCCTGHMEVAWYLISKGADRRCKDNLKHRTILHFLNKFRTKDAIIKILDSAATAEIDLDVKDGDGNTPLLSTFIGWDFSRGVAARCLMGRKSNFLATSNLGYSALSLAARSLEVDLVRELCNSLERGLIESTTSQQVPTMTPEKAKCNGFAALLAQTEFHNRRIRGSAAVDCLQRTVDDLLDHDSLSFFSTSEYSGRANPLISACYQGHEDLARAVLAATHCPDIDAVDEQNQMTALHWAAERGKTDLVMELLRKGADPLVASIRQYNVFQHSAIHSPRLLSHVLEAMERGKAPCPKNLDVPSILAVSTPIGESIFALLVIEGSQVHLEIAESLRKQYSLPYDDLCITSQGVVGAPVNMTLTAWLVHSATQMNRFSLEQFEYLFELNPRPRLVADDAGGSLLHYAVSSWQHGRLPFHAPESLFSLSLT